MDSTTRAIIERIANFPEEQHFTALKTAAILAMDHDGPGNAMTFAKAADRVNQCGTLEAFLRGEDDGVKGTCTSPRLRKA